ncbi:MAG: ATP-dependent Clp protease adapter ClpS [Magnetococcales bacterium]|nr:ATP-dependent Clp protease adapter ClpS [Magnetococcales bacterium]MBF0156176.1 ATP-dependent Clp protease adapter ClpS [Magnetococcales bacterium]
MSTPELETPTRGETATREPVPYRVMILNDDFTPMDFVVEVLQQFFGKSAADATEIMLHVHYNGKGLAGVYPREIAETKVLQVNRHSRGHGHPLVCRMERD